MESVSFRLLFPSDQIEFRLLNDCQMTTPPMNYPRINSTELINQYAGDYNSERYSVAGFYDQLNNDEQELVREQLDRDRLFDLKQTEEPKPKKSKSTEGNEEFDDLIRHLKWSQPEASGPLKPLLNDYRRYVCEQAAICIQQSFRKYLLLARRTASIPREAFGEMVEDRGGEENLSDSWSKEQRCDVRLANGCDTAEKCRMNRIHLNVRAFSEESDPNCDACSLNCSSICTQGCTANCTHDGHCPAASLAHSCYSSTNSLDGLVDYSKDSLGDCCSTCSCSPRCGHLAEGSFKSKKNELLNCSMDIDMCATKDEHPSFESDELKGKRCSPSSASLSCMEKLSAKR